MIELLSNCSHQSEIAIYLVTRSAGDKCIWKVAITPSGIANLKHELAGFEWYQGQRYPNAGEKLCRILGQKESYLKIGIHYIEGSKADFRQGLEGNESIVRQVISHYCEIWKPTGSEKVALHGDLSLDNILINSGGVHIIDWEHFSLKGAPWGFDAMYLLFETLYFGMRNRKRPSQHEINVIVDNISFLNRDNRLQLQLVEHPLRSLKNFISNNLQLWGEQLTASPQKLPILLFTEDQASLIDNMIFCKLRAQE